MFKPKLNSEQISIIVHSELSVHPFCEPVDIYKLLYQALYGPAHMVRDLEQICSGITAEFQAMKHVYQPYMQLIGSIYVRISLSMLPSEADLKLPMPRVNYLAKWMLDSCPKQKDKENDFIEIWGKYLPLLQSMLKGTAQAWKETTALVAESRIPSHSKLYHQHYDPHYRLVNINLKKQYYRFLEL